MKVDLHSGIVRSITGSVGSVQAALNRSPFAATPTTVPRQRTKRTGIRKPRFSPLRNAKSKIPDPLRKVWWHWNQCPCMAYTAADWVWIHGNLNRRPWYHAVKKSGMTGYALWMMEAQYCAQRALYMPDFPSVSGGFTTDRVIPGVRWQPPADCITPPTDSFPGGATFTWRGGVFGRWWLEKYEGITVTPIENLECIAVYFDWFYHPNDQRIFIRVHGPGFPHHVPCPIWGRWTARKVRTTWTYINGITLTYEREVKYPGMSLIPYSAMAVQEGEYMAIGPWK